MILVFGIWCRYVYVIDLCLSIRFCFQVSNGTGRYDTGNTICIWHRMYGIDVDIRMGLGISPVSSVKSCLPVSGSSNSHFSGWERWWRRGWGSHYLRRSHCTTLEQWDRQSDGIVPHLLRWISDFMGEKKSCFKNGFGFRSWEWNFLTFKGENTTWHVKPMRGKQIPAIHRSLYSNIFILYMFWLLVLGEKKKPE